MLLFCNNMLDHQSMFHIVSNTLLIIHLHFFLFLLISFYLFFHLILLVFFLYSMSFLSDLILSYIIHLLNLVFSLSSNQVFSFCPCDFDNIIVKNQIFFQNQMVV